MRTTLASLVEDFRRLGGRTAVVEHRGIRSVRTSYGELAGLAGRFAAELEAREIGPGERVVLWGENSALWMGVFFGCVLRGVLAVPLDAAGTPAFAERVLAEVGPRLVVADAALLGRLRFAGASLEFDGLPARLPMEPLFRMADAVGEETPFQIVFTSGTTSEPKGIVHTHRNVLASVRPIEGEIGRYRRYLRLVAPLRFLHTLPLSHVFGQFMGLWIPALLGAEVHMVDTLEAPRLALLIRRERISVLVAVPRVLMLLRTFLVTRYPELLRELGGLAGLGAAGRWWRFRRVHRALGWKFWAVISGGAALPAELEEFWNGLGFAVIQGYGMTETAALVTLNHPLKIGRGTLGATLPGREVRLSEAGEILVRGDVVSGATWQGGGMRTRQEEWLATGDLAERNAVGELVFTGRRSDVMVTAAGLNIHPEDLEAALTAQPGVRGAVVVACAGLAGPEPVAAVLWDGSAADLQVAVDAANRQLAGFQQIARGVRWPELSFPYTSTGKLLRRRVREEVCEAVAGAAAAEGSPDAATGDTLLALVAEASGLAVPPTADDRLRLGEDLRLDSLGRVQLAALLEERTGMAFGDERMTTLRTLGDLRAAVASSGGNVAASASMAPTGSDKGTELAGTGSAGVGSQGTGSAGRGGDLAAAVVAAEPGYRYPRWPWWWPVRVVRAAFVEAVLRPLVALLGRPRVMRSSPQLPPGPLLVIANHVTAYDGALVLFALPGHLRRRLTAAMSGEMLVDLRAGRAQGNWLLNLLGPPAYFLLEALFNVFPLPRLQGFRRSFAHAGDAMDHGYSVLIFPEGTRSRTGAMGPFRQGIGLLAKQAQVPVLPVALLGLYGMRRGGWFRSGRLEIRVGEPMTLRPELQPAEITALLEGAVRTLAGECAAPSGPTNSAGPTDI